MLTVEDVARHFGLRADTIRRHVRSGKIKAFRIAHAYRFDWRDVWGCEAGPTPKGDRQARYKTPLLDRRQIATAIGVSVRTLNRWIHLGLPTRDVFGNTRMNVHDVEDWLREEFGVELRPDWWR